jgi:hypothetical protein
MEVVMVLKEGNNKSEVQRAKLLRPLVISLLPLVGFLMSVGLVFADASFGSVAGPIWLQPEGYQFIAVGVTLSAPHDHVCLSYTPATGTGGTVACTDLGSGTWLCTIPQNYPDNTVNWQINAYSQATCMGDDPVAGPSGSFETGPTAVTLTGIMANSRLQTPLLLLLGILALAFSVTAVMVWRRAERYS